MDDSVRKMIIASICLVLAVLVGGRALGSWFYVEGELENSSYRSTEFTANFYLEDWEYELSVKEYGDEDNYHDTVFYDDNDCSFPDDSDANECDEMYDLMQGKIQKLLYVVILAGFAALYFLKEGDNEKGEMACLAMGGAGLLAVALFVLNFPEALNDDTAAFDIADDNPSLLGDSNNFSDDDNEVDWRPGLAFFLVALSGLIGMRAYTELKT